MINNKIRFTKVQIGFSASKHALIVSSAIISSLLIAPPANATSEVEGKKLKAASVGLIEVGKNTEQYRIADQGKTPFSISVDGQTVAASSEDSAAAKKTGRIIAEPKRQIDKERETDLNLEKVDIQIKYDGLEAKPLLNVVTTGMRSSFNAGEPVRFLATSNYPDFLSKAEIRISKNNAVERKEDTVAVIPVQINKQAQWIMPAGNQDDNFSYVLRVYDPKGRYDQTQPLTLLRSSKTRLPSENQQPIAGSMGEDRTAVRNIPINGGSVTVFGRNVPIGHHVTILGDDIPIDNNQSFVVQRILPPGDHDVNVSVQGLAKSEGLDFNRDINIPDNDWFYVGLADFTIGKRTGDSGIEDVRPGEYDSVYTKGRLAFYLKGKIQGKYLLTAAADTAEDDLDQIFRNIGKQNPRHILRRLDPDDYYPVYGDDSTMVEDAPTNGKFYVRLEKGDSHVMWGNFKTKISGTEFLRADRALYGAKGLYMPEEVTSFGARKTEVTVYAAQPDTLPQVDEFLGTGGSAYFLKRQNIIGGSETLTVEVRDSVTGRIIERRVLISGEDYRFDNLQGVVILKRPLSSSTGSSGPVRDGALGGNNVYLIAQYEYEPLATDLDGYSYGGRAQQWLNEKLRIGVTGMNETAGSEDHKTGGVDIKIRHSDNTYLDAEVAASKGQGFSLSRSFDGGMTVSDSSLLNRRDRTALAYRMKGRLDLSEISEGAAKGTIGGYYENREAGFSTITNNTNYNTQLWGADANIELTSKTVVTLAYDDFTDDSGKKKREGTTTISHELDEYWKVSFGVKYTDLLSPNAIKAGKNGYDGSRVDAGIRLTYRQDDDHSYYIFGQGTAERSGNIDRNDRGGIGTEIKLTETIGAKGEVSYGTHGWGGLAGLTYDPNVDDHYYLGYRLDPDRAYDLSRSYDLIGNDRGAVVGGMKRRLDDTLSAYAENSYDLFGQRKSLTQTYGVIYTPDQIWSINGGFEGGRVRDNTINPVTELERSDFDRYAPSLAIGFKDEETGVVGRLRGEMRIERSEDDTRDQNTYLIASGLSWKTNENWRAILSLDAVLSDTMSDVVSYEDTDYVEASFGYAYRPIDNDRLNALFKYSWLYDMPGNGQVVSGVSGDDYAPAQRSHILSADVNYDLFPWLTVGGKYGFRIGEVKYRILDDGNAFNDDWQRSSAHLGILRMDIHIVKKWDLLAEGRVLSMPEADTVDYGALLAVYRHVGENFKVGLGYNFGNFSDDLRDLSLNDKGVFVNLVGKF